MSSLLFRIIRKLEDQLEYERVKREKLEEQVDQMRVHIHKLHLQLEEEQRRMDEVNRIILFRIGEMVEFFFWNVIVM